MVSVTVVRDHLLSNPDLTLLYRLENGYIPYYTGNHALYNTCGGYSSSSPPTQRHYTGYLAILKRELVSKNNRYAKFLFPPDDLCT